MTTRGRQAAFPREDWVAAVQGGRGSTTQARRPPPRAYQSRGHRRLATGRLSRFCNTARMVVTGFSHDPGHTPRHRSRRLTPAGPSWAVRRRCGSIRTHAGRAGSVWRNARWTQPGWAATGRGCAVVEPLKMPALQRCTRTTVNAHVSAAVAPPEDAPLGRWSAALSRDCRTGARFSTWVRRSVGMLGANTATSVREVAGVGHGRD